MNTPTFLSFQNEKKLIQSLQIYRFIRSTDRVLPAWNRTGVLQGVARIPPRDVTPGSHNGTMLAKCCASVVDTGTTINRHWGPDSCWVLGLRAKHIICRRCTEAAPQVVYSQFALIRFFIGLWVFVEWFCFVRPHAGWAIKKETINSAGMSECSSETRTVLSYRLFCHSTMSRRYALYAV